MNLFQKFYLTGLLCAIFFGSHPIDKKSINKEHRTVPIVIIGTGHVGNSLAQGLLNKQDYIKKQFNVDLKICGLFRSTDGVHNQFGLAPKKVAAFLLNQKNRPLKNSKEIIHQEIDLLSTLSTPFILVDTTATDEILPLYLKTLESDGFVVTANKKILAGPQKDFDLLMKLGKDRLFYSATVGAGLPVISTLQRRLLAHDNVLEIKGVLSGTLGFIFSRLEDGLSFSQAAFETQSKGIFEPHPKEDLSGNDVARKMLILARIMGQFIEFSDIKPAYLYPPEMEQLNSQEFLKQIGNLDAFYQNKIDEAKNQGKVLRYVVALSNKNGSCDISVGIQAVDKTCPFYNLKGVENMVQFKTEIYNERPLVVQGPGGGIEITASNVFADICEILSGI